MKECVMKNTCHEKLIHGVMERTKCAYAIAINMYVNNVMNNAMNKIRGGNHTKNIHGIIHDIIHVHIYGYSHT